MLENSELKRLSRISGFRTTLAIVGDWLIVALGFAMAIELAHPLVWIFIFVLMGRQQLALAILMHDGAHRRLYRFGGLNDWIGQFGLAAPLLFSMDSYKKLHLKHHVDPLVADDPDLSLIGGYPVSKRSFARKILRDLLGVSYFKFIRYFIYMARRKNKENAPRPESSSVSSPSGVPKKWAIVSILLAQLVLFVALWSMGHPILYITLWLLPAMTILQVLLRIRGIAEHAGYRPNPDQTLNARTVINPVQTFLFAPHHVNYHIEHHVYPSVPFFRLPELHRILKERGVLPRANLYSGYGRVLAELIR